jgi:hypothetical protein
VIEYIYDQDERLVAWATEILGHGHRFRNDAKAIAMEKDGKIRGVVVFDTFGVNDCLMTVVSDSSKHWMTREFIIRVMAYPFVQLMFPRITCLISRNNKASIRFTNRFGGWKLEGVMREAGLDREDLLLYGMLARDCRWVSMPVRPIAV